MTSNERKDLKENTPKNNTKMSNSLKKIFQELIYSIDELVSLYSILRWKNGRNVYRKLLRGDDYEEYIKSESKSITNIVKNFEDNKESTFSALRLNDEISFFILRSGSKKEYIWM